MPFIVKIKETDQYRLFGSLPILCDILGFDERKKNSLSYIFSQKRENRNEDDDFLIVKIDLERGGKNNKK